MKKTVTLLTTIGAVTMGCVLLWAQNYPVCNPPTITTPPASQTRTQYQNVSFSVAINTNTTTPVSYQWRANGVNLVDNDHISAATTPTLTIFELTTGDAGSYDVVVSNSCQYGLVTSAAATLTVVTVNPTADSDGDGVNNMTELLQGRNHLIYGTTGDSGNLIKLQVFTPLK